MNVGDHARYNNAEVEIRDLVPDSNGEIGVFLIDGENRYRSSVPLEEVRPLHQTWRATHPEYGQVTIVLPTDGKREQQAVWSGAATAAVVAANPAESTDLPT